MHVGGMNIFFKVVGVHIGIIMETMDNVRTKKGMTKYTSSMKETRVPDNAFENVERKYAKLFLKELISSFSK